MKRGVLRWMLLFLMLAGLPSLACNLVTGQDDAPLVEEPAEGAVDSAEDLPTTAAPAATAVFEAEEPAAGDAPPFPQFGTLDEALAQFNSYRIQVEMRFEDGADPARAGTMTMTTARVEDPPASSVEIRVAGAFAEDMEQLGEQASLSFIEIGDTSYSVIPGLGCISGAAGADVAGEFDDVLDADEFLGEVEGAEYVGEETVNGVATYHYRFDETDVSQSEGQLTELTGDVFVSQEHEYVVRMVFEGVGQLDMFEENEAEGNVHFELDVLDVGQPITIEPPDDCGAAGSEYPVMEGASDLATFAGLTTYSVNASLEDVVAFYQEEMAALGYQASGEQFITEGTAILTFNAENMPSVTVTLGAEGDSVSVLITSEGG